MDTGYEQFLLSVDSYDPVPHAEFRDLIEHRLQIEIQYDSICGGERSVPCPIGTADLIAVSGIVA